MALVVMMTLLPALGATAAVAASAVPVVTVAGAQGLGPGTEVAMAPSDVVVRRTVAYVADAFYGVVRAVDLTSGVTTVVLRP
ncbi:MAG: hypothetical protein ACRD1K_03825 [Acidimicrobiales bacterium]